MNDNDEILWKLGILTSNLQSPKKYQGISNPAATAENDESDSEVVFDQKTLLENQPRRRTSPSLRPARVRVEALRWKLTCICAVVFTIGVSLSVFGPNACDFITYGASYKAFSANAFMLLGIGYLCGTFIGEQLFVRWNPFFVFFAQFLVLAPSLCSLSLIHDQTFVLVAWLTNGVILGSLERGCYLLYHSLFKERRSLIFFIQLCMIVGLLCGSFVFSQSASSFQSTELHLMQKRAISGFADNQSYVEFVVTTVPPVQTTERPKKPDAAVGIQQVIGKTEENEMRRKEAEDKKKSEELVDTTVVTSAEEMNCTDSTSILCVNGSVIEPTEIPNDANITSAEQRPPSTLSITTEAATTSTAVTTIKSTTTVPPTARTSMTTTTGAPSTTTIATTVAASPQLYETAATMSFVDSVHVDKAATDPAATVVPLTFEHIQYMGAGAFVLFALIPFIMGFCCCCLPFGFARDDRIAEIAGDQYLDADCGRLKMYLFIFWSLMTFCEMAAVGVLAGSLNETHDQFSVRFTFGMMAYWLGAALSRGALLIRPSSVISSTVVHSFFVLFSISSLVLLFANHQSTTGAISVFAMGCFGSPLSTCVYNWILSTLGTNTFGLSRVLAVSNSFGKVFAPVAIMSFAQFDGSTDGVFKTIFISVIVSAVLFFFIFRQLHTILRRRQIGELSSGVTGVSFHKKCRKDGYVTVLDEEDDSDVLSMDDIEMGDDRINSALLRDCTED